MDYSNMSPIDIAKHIVILAQHTDVESQPIPRCPWGSATALGALPVARALVELDAALDARKSEYMDENEALKDRIKELKSQVDIPRGSGYLAAQMADCLGLNEIPTVMGPLLHAAASLSNRAIKADELEKRIEYAMKTSNDRWEEWGVRAEAVCLILEGRDPYESTEVKP